MHSQSIAMYIIVTVNCYYFIIMYSPLILILILIIKGQSILLPAMCDKDKEDIKWGVENDIDFIAASFVRKASDVHEIRGNLVVICLSK